MSCQIIKIPIDEVGKHFGDTVNVCDVVSAGKYLSEVKGKPTLLNMGGKYPNHKLTILINPEIRKYFIDIPENFYIDKSVCVTGKLIDYNGKPEIVISAPEDIVIVKTDKEIIINPTDTICVTLTIAQNIFIDAKRTPILIEKVKLLRDDIKYLNDRISEKESVIKDYHYKDSLNQNIIASYESEIRLYNQGKSIYDSQVSELRRSFKKQRRKTKFVAFSGIVVTAGLIYLYITK